MSDYAISGNQGTNRSDRTDLWAKFQFNQENTQAKERDCDKIGSFLNGTMSAGAYMG